MLAELPVGLIAYSRTHHFLGIRNNYKYLRIYPTNQLF